MKNINPEWHAVCRNERAGWNKLETPTEYKVNLNKKYNHLYS